ncbi:hypothetical protein [Deinococcus navajonensis]|uniref:Uncharacterized protein n=1 Tax=Deinococcus navajonensis TaxID=309884 RepID=A0ABV8XP62_9DEIO
MVQTALDVVVQALAQLLALALPVAAVLAGMFLALVLVGLLDRDRFMAGLGWIGAQAPAAGRWLLLGLALASGAVLLRIARLAVDTRLGTQQSARYANAADPDGSQTVQSAPRVSLLQDTTYTRSLILPPDLYARIDLDNGWERLLPYISDAGSENLRNLREGFTRQRDRLIYTREVTLRSEQPVSLDTSQIATDLHFVEPAGGRGTYYKALFRADYTFRNPLPTPGLMRLTFPLPDGSGTLSDFQLTVNGQAFRAADLAGGSVWEGQVGAGAQVRVHVTYRNQGAKSWSYRLGQRREAIRSFGLTIHADRPARFQRYSLFPTRQTGHALSSQHTLSWQLRDVITAQDVAVVFAQGSLRETLTKVGFGHLLALLLAAPLCLGWAWSRRLRLAPLPLAAALVGLSLGLTLGSVLTAYVPVRLALLLGSAAALTLAAWALRRPFLAPLSLAAALPLTFLTGGNAGLLLTLLAALALLLLLKPAGRAVPAIR